MQTTIIFGVGMFTAIVLLCVALILFARSRLVSTGSVKILINGEKTITVPAGGKLLQTLSEAKLFLPSACGGGGTCAQCKCIISEGGGAMLPTEEAHFNRRTRGELALHRELVLIDVGRLAIDLIGQHERPHDAQNPRRRVAGIRTPEVERI